MKQPGAAVAQDVSDWQKVVKQFKQDEYQNYSGSSLTVGTAPQGAMTYTTANLGGLNR